MNAPFSVADVAAKLDLKPQIVNGKTEYHGKNPDGTGAAKDGFIVFEEGNAIDRKTGAKYTSAEVAAMAGIDPGQYEPVARYRAARGAANGHANGTGSAANGSAAANGSTPKPKKAAFNWEAATKHDYLDDGELLYQVAKIGSGPDKQISQRRPDSAGGWVYGLGAGLYEPRTRDGVNHWYRVKEGVAPNAHAREFPEARRVLYNRDLVRNASIVFAVEGESAADELNRQLEQAGKSGDKVATTNPHGAGKWRDEFAEDLAGATLIVLPDNDAPGDAHAREVCSSCHKHGATVKRVELPDLPPKGDVVEYFANGNTLDGLLALVHNSPIWTPPAKEKRFQLLTLAQLKAKPKPVYLIHGLLVKADTSLLTAKHASFKSFIALAMALCVACDIPFHGYEVAHGKVIYIAAEGAVGLTKRALAFCAHYDVDPGENFVVINSPIQIHDAKTRADFIEEIAELNPVLIVIDTLARCAVGLEENSSKDMGEFADALDALAKESGAHVMVVHHNNKGGDYRGSSAIPAAVGTHLSLERTGDTVTLKTEKQKDAEELHDLVFEKVEVSIPGTYGEESSLVFEKIDTRSGSYGALNPIEKKCLDALREVYGSESVSSAQWKRAAEQEKAVPESTFHKARKALVKNGRVVVVSGVEGGKGKNAALYAVAPAVREDDSTDCSTESVEQSKRDSKHRGNSERDNSQFLLSVEQNESVENDSSSQHSTLYTPLGVESVEQRVKSTGQKPKKKASSTASEPYIQAAPPAANNNDTGDAAEGDLF